MFLDSMALNQTSLGSDGSQPVYVYFVYSDSELLIIFGNDSVLLIIFGKLSILASYSLHCSVMVIGIDSATYIRPTECISTFTGSRLRFTESRSFAGTRHLRVNQ
ncbi:hypothetical protein F2P56_020430, partial [Juglans regia]